MSDAIEAAEGLARAFHETYERLAPQYGYETRADTKSFDPTTPNGQLMMAVCAVLIRKVALTAYEAAKGGGVGVAALLDAYDAETSKLPLGHETPSHGRSTFNWRRAVVAELRDLSATLALTSPASGSGTREEIKGAVGRETEGWPAETDHVPSPASGERDAPQCCMCGKKGLSTTEGDGGAECELADGRWVCSQACYDKAVPMPGGERDAVTQAAADVLAERKRQVEAEGWTAEHDDKHDRGEMASAAGVYALAAGSADYRWVLRGSTPNDYLAAALELWPWDRSWFKPKDRRRDLVKAGALILAEIERLDRAALRMEGK